MLKLRLQQILRLFLFFILYTTAPTLFSIDQFILKHVSQEEWNASEKFIQKKSNLFFSQGILTIAPTKHHPYPIEKDPETGAIYIHLKDSPHGYIGKGANKIVTKSILYGPKPRIVARCEARQGANDEAHVLKQMKGLRGVIQILSHIKHSENQGDIILEYYNGGNFRQFFKQKRSLADHELLPVILDLLIGLQGIHNRGYIHRDLHTGNILLHRGKHRLRALFTDLGLAIPINEFPDRRIGIPNSHAPAEVLLKPYREIDRRKSETYSLGVALYTMILHKQPSWSHFLRQEPLQNIPGRIRAKMHDLIKETYNKEIIEILNRATGLKRDVLHVIFKMLHPDPEIRISLTEANKMIRALSKKWKIRVD